MQSRLSALSASSPVSPGTACGCIFLIRSDPAHAHLLARSARAALAAADSVLHDDDVDPRILALGPSRRLCRAGRVRHRLRAGKIHRDRPRAQACFRRLAGSLARLRR
jgi:siroheme synthase